jgi:hypothetical protein
MNRIRRLAAVLAGLSGLACAWLGLVVASPAAFAQSVKLPQSDGGTVEVVPPTPAVPAITRVVVVAGGMPGWQIALIAIGAAAFAAVCAVLVYRALTARRHPATATA